MGAVSAPEERRWRIIRHSMDIHFFLKTRQPARRAGRRAHGCMPVSIQRLKTSVFAAGQAPSPGIDPSSSPRASDRGAVYQAGPGALLRIRSQPGAGGCPANGR